ncbi:MAG TPA: PLP-dependent aminotransferase family protein [Solirubrobacteraceae bacterium]|nr:PLP-dependent aminotransferase family protein [Solirubrobacteraceae bacterium]
MHLDIAQATGSSLRARIESALREAIRGGRLAPGTRLPSTRTLCSELGVSRGVVSEVYAQLAAEGYLDARRGAGTTVAASAAATQRAAAHDADAPAVRYDLSPYRPALSAFPRTSWLAALARVSRSAPDKSLDYPDPAGTPELRTALAAYLGRARGVQTTPQRIVVTASLRQGIALLWSVLARRGVSTLAVESPGWRGMRETAQDAGLRCMEVPVDEQGLVVEGLESTGAQVVAVAPAHQFPTGAVMSAGRRSALVRWCRRTGGIAVEDDYDAEYRYDRRPLGALQGLAPEVVVYAGSASKSLAPAMRLAWLALPESLAPQVAALQRLRGGMPAPLAQLAFAQTIERGNLDRHLRRQRRLYRMRRDALLRALALQLPALRITGAAAGLFIVLELPPGTQEHTVLAAGRANGLALEGLGGREPGILLGYANLDATAAPWAVKLLAQSIAPALRAAGQNVAP